MIASGESMIDVCKQLKEKGANRVFCFATFGLFTEGAKSFNKAYEDGAITKVFSTNLNYRTEEILNAPWYENVDMSKFLALIMDTMNHDISITSLLSPVDKIKKILEEHRKEVQ